MPTQIVMGIVMACPSGLKVRPSMPVRSRASISCREAFRRREQQRKLVPAEPGEHVLGAAEGLQAARDFAKHPVADGMAVSVIEKLEVVQVQHDDGQRECLHFRRERFFLQPLLENAMVQQLRQRDRGPPASALPVNIFLFPLRPASAR